jgi:hypothetical protein
MLYTVSERANELRFVDGSEVKWHAVKKDKDRMGQARMVD